MTRALILAPVMLLLLASCAVPAVVVALQAASAAVTATKSGCQIGKALYAANPAAFDGNPLMQGAELACEALIP